MARILSLQEFEAAFPDEEACWRYLVRVRWPRGFACPRCGGVNAGFIRTRKLFECKACGYQCSVTSGTLLHRGRLPLRTVFWGVFLVATTKKGVSACELQRKLGLGSYKTAWFLRRKIQHAVRHQEAWLRGLVEVDEVYVGTVSPGRGGRGTGKAPVAIAVEEKGMHAGRMAARVLPGVAGEILEGFVRDHVDPGTSWQPGAIVKTDGWRGYSRLDAWGYQHAPEVEGAPERATIVLPRVHIIAGNLKRVLNGTYAGRVSTKHMDAYVAEFRFRYNHRAWLDKALSGAFQHIVHESPLTFRKAVS
jgi:transposase-like protein